VREVIGTFPEVSMRSVGIFRYSPTLNGSLMRRDGGTTRWWLIIDCDPDLGRYLRHQFTAATYRTRPVQAPLWGPHISVIRGETPPLTEGWERLDGQAVEFEYETVIRETDGYLWVPVACEAALEHRKELGLPREPDPPLHLTIGNLKQD
jgi:hypothetical protein